MAHDEPATVSSQQAYALAPMSVILDTSLSAGAKTLYVYLDWRQGMNPASWASMDRMAADLGVSDDTICRWRAELEAAGYLTVVHCEGRPNRYTLHHRIERYLQQEESEEETPRKSAAPRTAAEGTPRKSAAPPPANLRHEHDQLTISSEQEEDAPAGLPPSTPPAPPDPAWAELTATTRPGRATTPLAPSTPASEYLFACLEENARLAAMRPGRSRFQTKQQRDRFRAAEESLGAEESRAALDYTFGEGFTELRRIVDYFCGWARRRERERQEVGTRTVPEQELAPWARVEMERNEFLAIFGAYAKEQVQQWDQKQAQHNSIGKSGPASTPPNRTAGSASPPAGG